MGKSEKAAPSKPRTALERRRETLARLEKGSSASFPFCLAALSSDLPLTFIYAGIKSEGNGLTTGKRFGLRLCIVHTPPNPENKKRIKRWHNTHIHKELDFFALLLMASSPIRHSIHCSIFFLTKDRHSSHLFMAIHLSLSLLSSFEQNKDFIHSSHALLSFHKVIHLYNHIPLSYSLHSSLLLIFSFSFSFTSHFNQSTIHSPFHFLFIHLLISLLPVPTQSPSSCSSTGRGTSPSSTTGHSASRGGYHSLSLSLILSLFHFHSLFYSFSLSLTTMGTLPCFLSFFSLPPLPHLFTSFFTSLLFFT